MMQLFLEDDGYLQAIEDIEVKLHGAITSSWAENEIGAISWQMVKLATSADPTLTLLRDALEDGTANELLPQPLLQYKRYWE